MIRIAIVEDDQSADDQLTAVWKSCRCKARKYLIYRIIPMPSSFCSHFIRSLT